MLPSGARVVGAEASVVWFPMDQVQHTVTTDTEGLQKAIGTTYRQERTASGTAAAVGNERAAADPSITTF